MITTWMLALPLLPRRTRRNGANTMKKKAVLLLLMMMKATTITSRRWILTMTTIRDTLIRGAAMIGITLIFWRRTRTTTTTTTTTKMELIGRMPEEKRNDRLRPHGLRGVPLPRWRSISVLRTRKRRSTTTTTIASTHKRNAGGAARRCATAVWTRNCDAPSNSYTKPRLSVGPGMPCWSRAIRRKTKP